MAMPGFLKGQESAGIRMSNFGGINSVHTNPAGLVNSKLFLDFNLLAGNISFENNFLFIHQDDYRLGDFLRRNPVLPTYEIPGEGLDYNAGMNLIQGFSQTDFYGPSFSVTAGKHAVGLFSRAVTMTAVRDLPGYLGMVFFEGLSYDTLHGIPQDHDLFDATVAGWWEAGISYAHRFSHKGKNKWSFGVNIRRLFGYAGMGIYANSADYTIVNEELIDIRNLDATVLLDAPVDYSTNEFPADGATFKGRGTAFDVGLSYQKNRRWPDTRTRKRPCSAEFNDYHYKFGVSLLNLGGLRFTENTLQQQYDNVSVEWQEIDTIEFVDINTLVSQLSQVFYEDATASTIDANAFSIGMPATLSLQGDLNYFPRWYLSGIVMLPLRLSKVQLRKPANALLSLRYETPAFEIALPVSLYDYTKPRIGLSARIYYLTIGTEKLGGFFGYNDFYGMDFYFSLKFHLLKGQCEKYKPGKDCRHLQFR
jgi:hypothetical protein